MKVYRCPNNCTVSDSKKRCSRCGSWLLYDGDESPDSIQKKTVDIQMQYADTEPQYRHGYRPNRDESGIHKSKFYMK